MADQRDPYYANLVRIIQAHPDEWSVASFAREAGLDQATIRVGLRDGSRPSMATVLKVRGLIGLDYDGVVAWAGEPIRAASPPPDELDRLSELLPLLPKEVRRAILTMALATIKRGTPRDE